MNRIPVALAAIVLATASSAAMADTKGEVLLFTKCDSAGVCPGTPTGPWPPAPGPSGKVDYSYFGPAFNFEFKGKTFGPGTSWTLIYYKDPWGAGVVCLGQGTPNAKNGELKIKGQYLTDSLPESDDANWFNSSPGAKIWLVPSADVECSPPGAMTAWNPAKILFEYNPIVYIYTP